jgi:hypothetical protein
LNQDELDLSSAGRVSRLPKLKSLPRPGSEAIGVYIAPDTQKYDGGVGQVLQGYVRPSGAIFAWVEPTPGKTDGVYRFSDPNNSETIHYLNMPSYNVDDESLSDDDQGAACGTATQEGGEATKLEVL